MAIDLIGLPFPHRGSPSFLVHQALMLDIEQRGLIADLLVVVVDRQI